MRLFNNYTLHYSGFVIPFRTLHDLFRVVQRKHINKYRIFHIDLNRFVFDWNDGQYTFDGGLEDYEYYDILEYLQDIYGDDYCGPTAEEIRSYFD